MMLPQDALMILIRKEKTKAEYWQQKKVFRSFTRILNTWAIDWRWNLLSFFIWFVFNASTNLSDKRRREKSESEEIDDEGSYDESEIFGDDNDDEEDYSAKKRRWAKLK